MNIVKPINLNRDRVLGRALVQRVGAVTPCPSLEEIAALVDGKQTDARRDDLFGHFAACPVCRDTYVLSKQACSPKSARNSTRTRHIWTPAIAIAVVMLIAVSLTLRNQEKALQRTAATATGTPSITDRPGADAPGQTAPQPVAVAARNSSRELLPPTAEASAQRLLQGEDPAAVVARAGSYRPSSYGFAVRQAETSAAFTMGVYSLTMELALQTEDRDTARMALMRISQFVPSAGGSEQLARLLEEYQHQIENGAPLRNMQGMTNAIVRELQDSGRSFYRFGIWCEAGRLAALLGKNDYFSTDALNYFTKNLPADKLPRESRQLFHEIVVEMKKPRIDLNEVGTRLGQLSGTLM